MRLSATTKARVPAGALRGWMHLLPAPYCDDPNVVVVLAPATATIVPQTSLDEKIRMMTMKHRDQIVGLQITQPTLNSWMDHSDAFMQFHVQIANPAHIGRISTIPQRLYMLLESVPLLFLRDQMSAPMLNLRVHLARQTKREGQEVN